MTDKRTNNNENPNLKINKNNYLWKLNFGSGLINPVTPAVC